MIHKIFNWVQKLLLCSLFVTVSTPTLAQISPDSTLGKETSQVAPNVLVNGAVGDRVDGGAIRGSNLFHSFSEFNINDGQRVYFGNPSGVENILTRVTGGNASFILGTLGVNGSANLFLINPSGILFGDNARLDVRGSFVGTTASGVRFGEQGIFSAVNPTAPTLLTIKPEALLFNQIVSGNIINYSTAPAGRTPSGEQAQGLRVGDGQNLLLVGGNVGMDGGQLNAFGGRVEIGAVAGTGVLGLNVDGSLDFPNLLARGNVLLINDAFIDVAGNNGGSVGINAKLLGIYDNSGVRAGIRYRLGNVENQGGDITLNVTDSLEIRNFSFVNNVIFPDASGNGGNIRITTDSLSVNDLSEIRTATYGKGSAGNIIINARDVKIDGGIDEIGRSSIVHTFVAPNAIGNAGNIEITTAALAVTNRSQLGTYTYGRGNAGNISINADNVQFDDTAAISRVGEGGIGDSGDIKVTTGLLALTNGGQLDVSTFGTGNSGNVIVNARNNIILDGYSLDGTRPSALFTEVWNGATGNAGDIRVSTNFLSVTNGAKLEASTRGKGSAGNIFVTANQVWFDGLRPKSSSGAFSSIEPGAVGTGGNIQIDTDSLAVTNNAQIGAGTEGEGNAGNVIINAKENVLFASGSAVMSTVAPGAVGNGASVLINAGSLDVLNGGQIVTATGGRGNAGNVIINARETVSIDGRSPSDDNYASAIASSVNQGGVGIAGNIDITAKRFSATSRAVISSETQGEGSAGSIAINAFNDVFVDNSFINSFVGASGVGTGGNISITTGELTLVNQGQISSATFNIGDAGNINIAASDNIFLDKAATITSDVSEKAYGNSGGIDITTGSLFLNNDAKISANTAGRGDAGKITIQARSGVYLDNDSVIGSLVDDEAIGDAGDIQIQTGSLEIRNAAQLDNSTFGQGSAGNVIIDARDTVLFTGTKGNFSSGILSTAERQGQGNGGSISINTGSIAISDGASVSTVTAKQGNAGNITITARDQASITNGGELQSSTTGIGKAGDISINATSLSMKDFAVLSAVTQGQGNAGNITINTRDNVSLNLAIISNIVGDVLNAGSFGKGEGGTIRIDTGLLSMTNGAQLQASTFGQGSAGNIIINARDSVYASGFAKLNNQIRPTAAFSVVANDSSGNGGNINVNTGSLNIEDGARFSVLTAGQGNAGNISITARDVVLNGVSPVGESTLSTATQESASGKGGTVTVNTNNLRISNYALINAQTASAFSGGDVTINANTFEAIQGGQITTTAFREGRAGNITLNADTVNLKGENQIISGLFADTTSDASATGGTINVNARQLNVSDRAQISVDSQGSGVAGDINIDARNVQLRNGANIIAKTASQDGGSISMKNTDLLLLRQGSLISATAAEGGNGGNINIDSKFIVAVPKEKSDISANAFRGRGGNVNIITQGLFGIIPAFTPTLESNITATSELGVQGQINISQPEVQPTQGIIELPGEFVDVSHQIGQMCPRGESANRPLGEFTYTGRGSLPPNPLQPLPGTDSLTTLATIDSSRNAKVSSQDTIGGATKNVSSNNQIVEAQGWVKTADGDVELVAMAPVVAPNSHPTASACGGRAR